jgi:hypothetical protein
MKLQILLAALVTLTLFPAESHAAPLINATVFPVTGGAIHYDICCEAQGSFIETGDFFTLYDAGAVPYSLTGDIADSSLFTITEDLTDPGYPLELITDDPTITNIRFTYIGSANLADSNLGAFLLADPSDTYRVEPEDGTGHTAAGFADSTASEIAPALIAPTPEPSTFALLGTGLLSVAGVARRKLSR